MLALVTLLLGIVSRSYEGYEGLAPRVVRLLERLVPDRREGGAAAEGGAAVGADYHYYGIPSPWLQARRGPPPPARPAALAGYQHSSARGRSSACASCSTSRHRRTRACCAR